MDKNEALEQALKMLLESVQQGKDFAIEQAPLVAQEAIAYGRVKYTVLCIVCTLILGVCAWGIAKVHWHFKSNDSTPAEDGFAIVTGIVAGLVALCVTPAVFACGDLALQAWFAPRLYLIEYIGSVLK